MNQKYGFLIFSILIILASSGVAEINAQADGDPSWLVIKSWEWDKETYQTNIVGGGTPFTAMITFENMKGETAEITRLTMATAWTPNPTWSGSVTIAPGATGTVEFTGQIAAGQTGDQIISLTGIVKFGGTEYKMTWMKGATLSASSQIPGFPMESIALGLLAAIVVLFAKRGIRLPRARFQ
jgi:hypothetical protein